MKLVTLKTILTGLERNEDLLVTMIGAEPAGGAGGVPPVEPPLPQALIPSRRRLSKELHKIEDTVRVRRSVFIIISVVQFQSDVLARK